jgi:BirA family transcriptional regulator, biotin operon repressor / biotin---[acetyl-CoA-carboxylase] ligase
MLSLEMSVLESLRTRQFGRSIRWADNATSTNTLARAWVRDGADEGATIVAEYQTAGKGRHGRKWDAERGQNLTLSIVLRPCLSPDRLGLVTIAACLGVADILAMYTEDGRVGIKWPNDVRIDGLKCCGMLLESVVGSPSDSPVVILGIGLNVNQTDFPSSLDDIATSMSLSAGRRLDRVEVLVTLLGALERRMDALRSGDSTTEVQHPGEIAMRREYEDLLEGRNGRVRFKDVSSGEVLEGRMSGIAENGGLVVMLDGSPFTLHAGEVTLLDIA